MMKLFSSKSALFFAVLLIALCRLCAAADGEVSQTKQPAVKPAAAEQKLNEQPVVKPVAEPTVVASIGDYVITTEELEKRLMMELYPYDYANYSKQAEPVDAEKALMTLLAEKAMVLEARKLGYLEDEMVHSSIKRFKERRLVNLLLQTQLQDKIVVTEDEIKQKMQTDPKLDKAQAKAAVEKAKANRILDLYYRQVYQKSHVRKLRDNFPRVMQAHQRLLHRPKQPRKMGFIRTSQINDELTPEEKNIVLAEYDYGKVTLKDWFDALCEIVPPRRPKAMNTPKDVEQLLERVLRMPLLVSQAKLAGLDKDKNLLKEIREYEDRRLLSEAKLAKHKEVMEPTTEQIIVYFNENKEAFGTSESLKIDLIWCQDLQTARKAKAELDIGKDFELIRQKYSLEKKGKSFNTRPSSEGLFWKDLSAGKPNQIIGPVKGFYRNGIKWRIVKILERNPGEVKEYSNDMQNQVKNRIMGEQKKALVAKYGKELLKKYPYQIYPEKVRDVDPLDIP
ncbi:MAG: peptidylprolyl isomerase [Planctomycetota bacterium]|jgi:hypothetical protein